MPNTLDTRWPELKRLARSEDEFQRTVSLATAVSCLEVALAASRIERQGREGIQARLHRSNFASAYPGAPRAALLTSAIDARNRAIHEHGVDRPDQCQAHLDTLYKAWCALRRVFVTKEKAAGLAATVLASGAVSTVFLFGSLARGGRDPKDIDLLLFDDGEYSFSLGEYVESESLLEEEFFSSPVNQAARRCGWLDYIFVDGTRFGKDQRYTLSLAQRQADPLFFVNISANLLQFDPTKGKWADKRPQVFQRLAGIRRQLQTENIVSPKTDAMLVRRSRRRQPR